MDPERPDEPTSLEALLLPDEIERWDGSFDDGERTSLVELINRVLDKGVVVTGHVTLSVAGVDLVYLGINAVLTSVATARRAMDDRAVPPRLGRDRR